MVKRIYGLFFFSVLILVVAGTTTSPAGAQQVPTQPTHRDSDGQNFYEYGCKRRYRGPNCTRPAAGQIGFRYDECAFSAPGMLSATRMTEEFAVRLRRTALRGIQATVLGGGDCGNHSTLVRIECPTVCRGRRAGVRRRYSTGVCQTQRSHAFCPQVGQPRNIRISKCSCRL